MTAVNLHTITPMIRICAICLFNILFVNVVVYGQIKGQVIGKNSASTNLMRLQNSKTIQSNVIFEKLPQSKEGIIKSSPIVPLNHYLSNLGFFCKKEIQIQKAVKLPIFFRLGSLEYTDKMEGKHGTIRY